MKRLLRLSLNHKSGLTLAELIVALAVIPGLLLAASVFYTHVARAMQETTDRGNTITQREQIVNMLQRYIANGNSATVADSGKKLTVKLPDSADQIYEFVRSYADDTTHLYKDGEPITFSGTNQMNKYAGYISEQESGQPFSYNSDTKTVTVRLQFHTLPIDPSQCDTNPNFPNCPTNVTFDIKLRGGDVAP